MSGIVPSDGVVLDEVAVRTEPFALDTSRGVLRGLWQYDPRRADPRGTVLIAPPFGVEMRRGQAGALYFLLNGYDVVRFDPTDHVGTSDGEIFDLTPTGLVEDLRLVTRWALGRRRAGRLHLFATSVSARLSFAMIADSPAFTVPDGDLAAVATVSAVVNMARTIAVVGGRDLVGEWLDGRAGDPQVVDDFMKHKMRWRFVEDLVDRGWHTPGSTAGHVGAMGSVPLLDIQGARDEWVDVDEAKQVFGDRASVVVLSDAVHALNPASARTAMLEVLSFYGRAGGLVAGPVAMPDFQHVVTQGKVEAKLGAGPGAEAVHRITRKAIPRELGERTIGAVL